MTPENFAYWLQGFAEIADKKAPNDKEWQIIKDHLQLVFDKKTPTYPISDPNVFPKWQEPHTINPSITCEADSGPGFLINQDKSDNLFNNIPDTLFCGRKPNGHKLK